MEGVASVSPVAGSLYAPNTTAKSLDDLLLQCIDEILAELLGRRAREAVYDSLERSHSLGRSDIPRHLNKLLGLLEETFGKGSRTIGKAIIRRLFDKLEWKFQDIPGFEFMNYMEAIEARIARALTEHAKRSM